MKFRDRSLRLIAGLICGSYDDAVPFLYRSSSYLTEFFQDCGTDHKHDGSSRVPWVTGVLSEILAYPQANAQSPPDTFLRVIDVLMEQTDARKWDSGRTKALEELNKILASEGFEAFYDGEKRCHLRSLKTQAPLVMANPHRPLSPKEVEKRQLLRAYLERISEDELIEEVLLPLFRQLGFHRVTLTGHKEKSLEFGKDLWMKFRLPTTHTLYFGLQVKKGKLDAAGATKGSNTNVSEVYNQILMMLRHVIFDPEANSRVLIDHGIIVAGGEITKAAKSWLGEALDASQRSQVLFMGRDDILDLYITNSIPLPPNAIPPLPTIDSGEDDVPF